MVTTLFAFSFRRHQTRIEHSDDCHGSEDDGAKRKQANGKSNEEDDDNMTSMILNFDDADQASVIH